MERRGMWYVKFTEEFLTDESEVKKIIAAERKKFITSQYRKGFKPVLRSKRFGQLAEDFIQSQHAYKEIYNLFRIPRIARTSIKRKNK